MLMVMFTEVYTQKYFLNFTLVNAKGAKQGYEAFQFK